MDNETQPTNLRIYLAADTSEEIMAVQHEIWMRNSLEKRVSMILDFMEDCRQMNIAGIKSRNPTWSEAEVKREFCRLAYSLPEDQLKNMFTK
jgi:hypothetical protein